MYDARSDDYDKSWHVRFAKQFVDFACLKTGEKVLDLACGTGLVTFYAADAVGKSGEIVGVDASSGMISRTLQKIWNQGHHNVEIYQHDIVQLDSLESLLGRTFDVITICSALVLLEDPGEALKSWTNYLKPDGRLVLDVTTPKIFPAGLALERTGKRLGVPVAYYRDWASSEEAVKKVIESASLHIETLVEAHPQAVETIYHDIAAADERFEKHAPNEATKLLVQENIRMQAKEIFREEWANMAIDGKVISEDVLWLIKAVK
jgi:ubiquinone/menaquinone biosynthesis C-methylase UbiE